MSLTRSLMSVDLGRGTRRFQRFVTLGGAKPSAASRRGRAASSIRSCSGRRCPQAFRKLDPRLLIKNPVMFVVEITAVLVTLICDRQRRPASSRRPDRPACGFQVQIAIWLWFTVLFATYAEAVAEARGRAQAATLRKTRSETTAHRRLRRRLARGRRLVRAAQGRHHRRRGGRDDPRRRRRHRGRRLRQRGGDHRRVGAGAQGAGHGHPQLGHRRHDARQRPARHPRHRRSRARRSSTG